MDATETDDASIIGEACHIVAQMPDGARGESDLSSDQRDKYDNLILLCNIHHKVIDDQPVTYSVDALKEQRAAHEQWVREALGLDNRKQRDDEVYASYVEEWASRMQVENWRTWASSLILDGQPSLSHEMKKALEEVRPWLLSRVWPGRYPELESAFLNFRLVVQDLSAVFGEHAAKRGQDDWETEKFYRIDEWNPELYQRLAKEFHAHVALVEDLALELTRAANYVCDKVRDCLMPRYRTNEGVVLIDGGPYMDLTMRTYRVEYRQGERTDRPYSGLEEFKSERFNRDFCFGEPGEEQLHRAQDAPPGADS